MRSFSDTLTSSMAELCVDGPTVQSTSSFSGSQQVEVMSAWLQRPRRTLRRLRIVAASHGQRMRRAPLRVVVVSIFAVLKYHRNASPPTRACAKAQVDQIFVRADGPLHKSGTAHAQLASVHPPAQAAAATNKMGGPAVDAWPRPAQVLNNFGQLCAPAGTNTSSLGCGVK